MTSNYSVGDLVRVIGCIPSHIGQLFCVTDAEIGQIFCITDINFDGSSSVARSYIYELDHNKWAREDQVELVFVN